MATYQIDTEKLGGDLGRVVTPAKRLTLRFCDLYCGAGGTSTGAEEAFDALGYDAEMTAVNHWRIAVNTHTLNHPGARHLCTGVDKINPRELYRPGELGLLWASPECTHHSVARGGKPINDQSRATAWCVTRWADALLPPVILVENVPEFVTWGPLDARVNGKPIKAKKGAIFRAWVASLESLGYKVEYRVLCAADYGDPTTRRRLFVQCQRGPRRKVVWPLATHGEGTGRPWVPASEIIDWALEGRSIFDRKKPLVVKSIRRILTGFERFAAPFLLPSKSGENRARPVTKPVHTLTTESRGEALVQSYIVGAGGPEYAGKPRPVSVPMNAVTTENHRALVKSFIVEHRGTAPGQLDGSAKSMGEPISPVATSGAHHAKTDVTFLVQMAHGNGKCGDKGDERRVRATSSPLPPVCGNRGDFAAVASFLVPNFGEAKNQEPRVHGIADPAPAVTSHGAGALVSTLLQQQSGGVMRPVSEPAPAVATAGAIAKCDYVITHDHQGGNGACVRSAEQALADVGTKQRHGLCRPFLVKYYGAGIAVSLDRPMPAVTVRDRFGLARPRFEAVQAGETLFRRVDYFAWKRLVLRQSAKRRPMTRLYIEIEDRVWMIEITHRMLQVHELAGAQGFRKSYQFTGNKTEMVKQIGNAVPRRLARALAAAAWGQKPDVSGLLEGCE